MLSELKIQEGLRYANGTLKNWNVTLGHLQEFGTADNLSLSISPTFAE